MAETTKKVPNGGNGQPISKMLEATLAKVRELGDAETIIGKPVVTDSGVTIIPVSRLTCGFGAGGSDYNTRHNANAVLFGGGGGAGVEVTPVSFIVIRGDQVDVLPASGTVTAPAAASGIVATVEKAVDAFPGILEKIDAFLSERKAKNEAQQAEKDASEIPVGGTDVNA